MLNTRLKKIAKQLPVAMLCLLLGVSGCKSSSKSNPSAPALATVNSIRWVTNATAPAVSPNGRNVLFKRSGIWYLHDSTGTDTHVFTTVQPTSVVRWFSDNQRVVFSVSGALGSDTNGVYIAVLPSGTVTRLQSSGRDPVPWESASLTESILYEETNPLLGIGLYKCFLTPLSLQRMGLYGSNPVVSPNGNAIAYLGGANGVSPCYASASDNWNEHSAAATAYHVQFLTNDTLCYDGFSQAVPSIYSHALYSANTSDPILFDNAGQPVTSISGAIAYQIIGSGSTELILYRNQVKYHVTDNATSYCITANGRVVYEIAGDVWITD